MGLIPAIYGSKIACDVSSVVPASSVLLFGFLVMLSLFTELWIIIHTLQGYLLVRDCGEHLLQVFNGKPAKAMGLLAAVLSVVGKYDTFADIVFCTILCKCEPISWV